jgi:hypothetical protein
MKQFALWFALTVAVVIAASLAVMRSRAATKALEQFVSPGALSPRHAYLAGRCTSCHEATVGVTVAKCSQCHATDERLLGRQPTAFHASVRECAACHVEHQGISARPLTLDHVTLAKIGARTLARASRNDPESLSTLESLKTWFRVSGPENIGQVAAREALNCAGCHDRRDPHFNRFGSDCAACHQTASWTVPGYQHPSPRSTECVQCHLPPPSHTMMHFSMISQRVAGKEHARVEECFECHTTTSWNDIVGVGFYKHH